MSIIGTDEVSKRVKKNEKRSELMFKMKDANYQRKIINNERRTSGVLLLFFCTKCRITLSQLNWLFACFKCIKKILKNSLLRHFSFDDGWGKMKNEKKSMKNYTENWERNESCCVQNDYCDKCLMQTLHLAI
jgi:hypothetical protein